MRIIDVAQGSQEWLEARAGVVTASEADELVTPLGKVRTGKDVEKYLARKLAEKWQGPLPANTFWNADQGHFGEQDVIGWYEFKFNVEVQRVGFITTDDGLFGVSPDGLEASRGLEIKSPGPSTQVRYLLSGEVPAEYIGQVQMGLWVTKYPCWRFISKRNPYPVLMLDVAPDEKYQAALSEALEAFSVKFSEGWDRLLNLNGGPPPERIPMTFSTDAQPNYEGITP
jgi:hypothetical protein